MTACILLTFWNSIRLNSFVMSPPLNMFNIKLWATLWSGVAFVELIQCDWIYYYFFVAFWLFSHNSDSSVLQRRLFSILLDACRFFTFLLMDELDSKEKKCPWALFKLFSFALISISFHFVLWNCHSILLDHFPITFHILANAYKNYY